MTDEQFTAAVLCDLDGEATEAELAMLRSPENLVRWARTVLRLRRDAEDGIAEAKDRLLPLKPRSGDPATPEYLAVKDDVALECAVLRTLLARVKTKLAAIADLIGAAGVTPVTLGEWITTLVHIEDLLADGDAENAHALITSVIDRWEQYEAPRQVAS